MAKSQLRLQARQMREKGLGMKTIAHALSVSSSTVSLWCRDIILSPQQIYELERRSRDPHYGRRLVYSRRQQEVRKKKVSLLFEEGKREVGGLKDRELFIAGIALYWAEGFKKDNMVGFSNSDPSMIKVFIDWLQICGIKKDRLKFRLGINEFHRDRVGDIEQFWQQYLGINPIQFQKPFLQKVLLKKVYENHDEYHGVLRVRVAKSTDLLRKIHGWIAGLKSLPDSTKNPA